MSKTDSSSRARCTCNALAVSIISVLAGCDQRETPLSGSGQGLGPSDAPTCDVILEIPEEADVPAIHAAAAAWREVGAPRVRFKRVPYTTLAEDGRFQLGFGVPGAHCRNAAVNVPGSACLGASQEGATWLRQSKKGDVLEGDMVLSRTLLAEPVRLREVAIHEFGHLFGLDHPLVGASGPDVGISIMTNPAPRGAERPGSADIRALGRVYGERCRR